MHLPIIIERLALTFPHRVCFDEFTTSVCYGTRIALIGRNGSGKSSLLQMVAGLQEPSAGKLFIDPSIKIGTCRK